MYRRTIIEFLLIVAIAAGLILLAESGLRVWDIVSGNIINSDLIFMLYNNKTETHPFLSYTARKNFEGFLPFIEPGMKFYVSINSHGFRTHEFYPKLENQYRILILGDSFVYGYNASQDDTLAAVMERKLKENISDDIEVLSLGITSYSCIRYAVLMRLYLDYLNPDMVIVAVDQSDFEEDLKRMQDYVLDKDGVPLILKDAKDKMDKSKNYRFIIDNNRDLKDVSVKSDWKTRLRVGSSLYARLRDFIKSKNTETLRQKIKNDEKGAYPVVRYEDLIAGGKDLSKVLPPKFLSDTIPYDIDTAIKRYQASFIYLKYIRDECARRGIALYFSSYPYPWMVSTDQSVPYQLANFKCVYDFRKDRVPTMLMEAYSRQLGVPHLNAYPLFEHDSKKRYGDFDPHFNKYGYQLYADFLYDHIKEDVKKSIKHE